MKITKFASLLFVVIFFILSCTPPPTSQGGGNQNAIIEIEITGTETIELSTETVSQPNCTGTAEVENTIEKSRTIQYVIEVQNGGSVNANGQVGFAGTDVELGATVASQFGQSYGASETLTRSITVKAKPETSMQHVIKQIEIWKIGRAKISVGGQQTIIPFKFRSDFAIELVNSKNIYPDGCDTLSTSIPNPQILLLRAKCNTEYTVRASEPIFIYYGGWAAKGLELTQQWTTAISTNLVIDGLQISGEQHPPSADLPLNCPNKDFEDSYWIYYTTLLSGLSLGEHNVTVTFTVLKTLPDNSPEGEIYNPGQTITNELKIIAK